MLKSRQTWEMSATDNFLTLQVYLQRALLVMLSIAPKFKIPARRSN